MSAASGSDEAATASAVSTQIAILKEHCESSAAPTSLVALQALEKLVRHLSDPGVPSQVADSGLLTLLVEMASKLVKDDAEPSGGLPLKNERDLPAEEQMRVRVLHSCVDVLASIVSNDHGVPIWPEFSPLCVVVIKRCANALRDPALLAETDLKALEGVVLLDEVTRENVKISPILSHDREADTDYDGFGGGPRSYVEYIHCLPEEGAPTPPGVYLCYHEEGAPAELIARQGVICLQAAGFAARVVGSMARSGLDVKCRKTFMEVGAPAAIAGFLRNYIALVRRLDELCKRDGVVRVLHPSLSEDWIACFVSAAAALVPPQEDLSTPIDPAVFGPLVMPIATLSTCRSADVFKHCWMFFHHITELETAWRTKLKLEGASTPLVFKPALLAPLLPLPEGLCSQLTVAALMILEEPNGCQKYLADHIWLKDAISDVSKTAKLLEDALASNLDAAAALKRSALGTGKDQGSLPFTDAAALLLPGALLSLLQPGLASEFSPQLLEADTVVSFSDTRTEEEWSIGKSYTVLEWLLGLGDYVIDCARAVGPSRDVKLPTSCPTENAVSRLLPCLPGFLAAWQDIGIHRIFTNATGLDVMCRFALADGWRLSQSTTVVALQVFGQLVAQGLYTAAFAFMSPYLRRLLAVSLCPAVADRLASKRGSRVASTTSVPTAVVKAACEALFAVVDFLRKPAGASCATSSLLSMAHLYQPYCLPFLLTLAGVEGAAHDVIEKRRIYDQRAVDMKGLPTISCCISDEEGKPKFTVSSTFSPARVEDLQSLSWAGWAYPRSLLIPAGNGDSEGTDGPAPLPSLPSRELLSGHRVIATVSDSSTSSIPLVSLAQLEGVTDHWRKLECLGGSDAESATGPLVLPLVPLLFAVASGIRSGVTTLLSTTHFDDQSEKAKFRGILQWVETALMSKLLVNTSRISFRPCQGEPEKCDLSSWGGPREFLPLEDRMPADDAAPAAGAGAAGGDKTCVVCWEPLSGVRMAFVPCGHVCCCDRDAEKIVNEPAEGIPTCPICRTVVQQALKLFL